MKKIILLGIISFIIFVLISAPATLILPYVNQSPYFQAQDAQGSIFSAKMQTTGEIESISYQLNIWQLLLANLSLDVEAKRGTDRLYGNLKVDLFTQKISLENLSGQINLELFQQYLPELSVVEPRGNLAFKNLSAAWEDLGNNPIPQRLSGIIELLKLNALEQDFGDYEMLIETKSANIIGILTGKKSAKTDAKVKFELKPEKRQLSISGKVSGKNKNVSAILQQLNIGKIKQIISY